MNLNPTDMMCQCHDSPFKDSHHQHVVTGNLDIIENIELRSLLKKGLNYRDQAPPNKHKALKAVTDALNRYINKKSNKASLPVIMFAEWKDAVLTSVKNKLDSFPTYEYNAVLQKPSIIDELTALQDKFVFVPTDKASNNVSVVCKKFYVQLHHDEINSNTYELHNESVEDIIKRHETFLQSMGIKMHPDNRQLPYLYATTKMHKTPTKFRYITSGKCTSLTQLSVAVGLCLQRGLRVAKNQSRYNNKFHRRNDFYVIDSNVDILDFMFNSNLCSGRKDITTFDFSTLYTSIPHDQLKVNLSNFVNRIFDIKDKFYIVCNLYNKCPYFSDSNNVSKSNIVFTKSSLIECLHFLIDNSFVVFNDCVYRQVVGIPMGTNSGPHIANIYLHQYEYDYFIYLYENDMKEELANLEHIFRFQDDLISFNDNGYLEACISNIYPPEMIVNKTNISVRKSNFFPPNAFLRRRRKKALLRVNDRGGGWRTCILAYVVCVYVRTYVTRGHVCS